MISKEVNISAGDILLEGTLTLPLNTSKLVLFSHGSGSSRFSPRNNMVADIINRKGIGTLLFDLLSKEEDSNYENRFDIDLLSKRVIEATIWARNYKHTRDMRIGYFGASTGAASALNAAAILGDEIKAVVSRGGRPDMSMHKLSKVKCPVLLIVGEQDIPVITLNQQAYNKMRCKKELTIIPGATHLFEEPGKMKEVAALAANWFDKHL